MLCDGFRVPFDVVGGRGGGLDGGSQSYREGEELLVVLTLRASGQCLITRERLSLDEERPSWDRGRLSLDEERPSWGRGRLSSDEERPSWDRGRLSLDEERPSWDRGRLSLDEERPSWDGGRLLALLSHGTNLIRAGKASSSRNLGLGELSFEEFVFSSL